MILYVRIQNIMRNLGVADPRSGESWEWRTLGVANPGSGEPLEWWTLGVANPGSVEPWEWRTLGVVNPGSGGPWEWRTATVHSIPTVAWDVDGALVESITFNRRVVGTTPALATT